LPGQLWTSSDHAASLETVDKPLIARRKVIKGEKKERMLGAMLWENILAENNLGDKKNATAQLSRV